MSIDARALDMGIDLRNVEKPNGCYAHVIASGPYLWLSGHGAFDAERGQVFRGKIGQDYTIAEGQEIARFVGIGCLSTLKSELGSLNAIKLIARVTGYVNVDPDFEGDISPVANGASELFVELFGPEIGTHSRMSLGVASTPRQTPFAMDMVVEV